MPRQQRSADVNRTLYAGRWVARLEGRIIGQGGTPEQALWAAKASRHKEFPQIEYMPTMQPLIFSERLEQVRIALPPDLQVYLVGGAVRDALLGRATHDLDFILAADALGVGRRVAEALKGAYYPLDEDRQTARVILTLPDGTRDVLDFSLLRGSDLESDLRARDFTINAMALDVRKTQELLDPLGGAADLHAHQLRACASTTFIDDPVRILRSVRLAAAYGLRIQRESLRAIRQAIKHLERVSVERKRDEVFRILGGPQPASAIHALDMIGALEYVLPELSALKQVQQSPPHVADVWAHTLSTLRELENVLGVLQQQYDPDKSASLSMGLVSMQLGRFREHLSEHLGAPLVPDRTLRSLLFLAALYHDAGKSGTRQEDEHGRVRFIEHEHRGAELAQERGAALHLSNDEIERLVMIVRHHLRPVLLAQGEQPPTSRAVYRFFRDTGVAGIDICLLSLGDVLATYGAALPQDIWARHLDIVRILLEAWWEHREERVAPPALVSGHDLMRVFGLTPGKLIGDLLEAVREGQATGQVKDRADALALARDRLEAIK